MVVIEPVEQVVTPHRTAFGAGKECEQSELHARQIECLTIQRRHVGVGVEADTLGYRHRRADAVHAHATQQRTYARDQFARAERLAKVIVRAQLQAEQAVDLVDARRDHDDGDVGETADVPADVEAIPAGQHEVEQYSRGLIFLYPCRDARALCQMVDFEVGRLEIVPDDIRERLLVLDDEHRRPGLRHLFSVRFHARGNSSTTARPPSSDWSALMLPPCAVTMLWQIDNPSPEPPVPRLRDCSTR